MTSALANSDWIQEAARRWLLVEQEYPGISVKDILDALEADRKSRRDYEFRKTYMKYDYDRDEPKVNVDG